MTTTRRAAKPRARDKSYTPDPRVHTVLAPLADGDTAWRPWPGPVAHSKPPCSVTGCRRPVMTWNRCRCGQVFALCGDHGQPPRTTITDRDEHRKTCAIARGDAP